MHPLRSVVPRQPRAAWGSGSSTVAWKGWQVREEAGGEARRHVIHIGATCVAPYGTCIHPRGSDVSTSSFLCSCPPRSDLQ
eukprot:765949-Hanusia_phi.AAC.3